jgi:hypothetical protein
MALINSVHVRSRGTLSWNDRKESLPGIVRQGLEDDGYIVLTLDDSISGAAQVCKQCKHYLCASAACHT